MISKEKMKEYNEALKTRPLTKEEWDDVTEYVESKGDEFIDTMSAEYPLLSIKYQKGGMGYKMFLKIICKLLNEDPVFAGRRYNASVVEKEFGDGSGMYMEITMSGARIAAMSALEDYFTICEDNGMPALYTMIEDILTKLRCR